jgi:2-polyprenyl-3-methyl-5-hydroxy-6-metoxy-1,4-benzoquinol methylase
MLDLPPDAYVVGIDISQRQLDRNRVLQEKILGDIQTYPIPERAFDLIICWDVLEHVQRPGQAVANLSHGLRNGGLLLLAMPNVRSFKGALTKVTPHALHVWIYRVLYGHRLAGRDGRGPFPTYLRPSMTVPALRRLAGARGLEVAHLSLSESIFQERLREQLHVNGSVWEVLCRSLETASSGRLSLNGTEVGMILRRTDERSAPSSGHTANGRSPGGQGAGPARPTADTPEHARPLLPSGGTNVMHVDDFLRIAAPRSGYRSAESLRFRCKSVFKDVDLSGRTVLEIGAGRGDLCFWAAYQGASTVVGLEPEIEGSSRGAIEDFESMMRSTGFRNVTLRTETIQEHQPPVEHFDVVVSHNSMEHLDEDAVAHIDDDRGARQVYAEIVEKIARAVKPGGYFIICNHSRRNFWPMIGRKNPFSPTLEWHIHPTPRTWKRLLRSHGFRQVKVDWPHRYRARRLGPLVTNPLFAFFTDSMFRLVARRI